MNNWKVCLILCLLAIVLTCWLQSKPQELPAAHRIFLPMIVAPPRPAQKGVCGFAGLGPLNTTWTYSWTWRVPAGDRRYVPMIRDMRQFDHLDEALLLTKASGWLMGFNEPDLPEPGGCDLSSTVAAIAWHNFEVKAQDIKLLSPAPSQHDFGWLWRMVAEYERLYGRKPRFDAIAVHYYGSEPQKAKQFLLRVRSEALAHGYGCQIWLTEFAGYCTLPDPKNGNERMIRELIPWMRQQPWIGRYSWFMSVIRPDDPTLPGFTSCSLLDYRTLQPTPLGILYRDI